MIYDFPDSVAIDWQKDLQRAFRKWMGLNATTEASILYRHTEHFGLNFKYLPQSLRTFQVTKWHIMKHAKDDVSRAVYRYRLSQDRLGHVGRGRKWVPTIELESLEGHAATRDMVECGQVGRLGLGFRKKPKVTLKSRRHDLTLMTRDDFERKRIVALGKYTNQAKWLSVGLDNMMHKDLTWQKLLYQCSDRLVKFIVNAIPNWLSSPDNLRRWNIKGDHKCDLCGHRNASLGHILGGCPWVLNVESTFPYENRYLWRHNCVLLILARAIQAKIKEVNQSPLRPPLPPINFVKSGSVGSKSQVTTPDFGILEKARDWICDFDLPEFHSDQSKFVFPHVVCMTPLRIDGYILSMSAKVCIAGPELTVPMEEWIHHSHSRKMSKYQELLENKSEGWEVVRLVTEVGSRGFIPPSFVSVLKKIGFTSKEVSTLRSRCSLMSQRCSYVIWLNRSNANFRPWRFE